MENISINEMSIKDVIYSILLTQLFVLGVAIIGIYLFAWEAFKATLIFNLSDFFLGLIIALVVIAVNMLLMKLLPYRYFDDGGINKKIFTSISPSLIAMIALMVSICEELLFRGFLQNQYGIIISSILFAAVHFRYLKKPILFVSVLMVSVFLGWMYQISGSIALPVCAHFFIDFLLGIIIRYQWYPIHHTDRGV